TTSIERAVALTYLGRASEAIALLGEGVDQPADRAFVYYRYASQTDDAALFHKALEAYRLARDSRGIGDTLFSLAKLSRENGDTGEARHYAQRAIHALSASGDTARADTIKAWLDAQ
ncbi:MAG: hypothetical protein KDI19_10390, partial [Pseudomonadales bacterium]|nr:hypothetical protein [Pseudomonadales bacterium]